MQSQQVQNQDTPARTDEAAAASDAAAAAPRPSRRWGGVLRVVRNLFLLLLETVLLCALALYGAMYVLCRGPSPAAGKLFALSVRETSAIGFLANFFYTDEELAAMVGPDADTYKGTDPSLIVFPTPTPPPQEVPSGEDPGQQTRPEGPQPDPWGLVDEDGDGIILCEVAGSGYKGYMMVVLDPSRVIFASVPELFGTRGFTVAKMVKRFGAVAGVNAGGFYDPGGQGDGSIPDSLVVWNGTVYNAEYGTAKGFAGFDRDHVLHVGRFTAEEIEAREIENGVCFGPVLIANGKALNVSGSGLNPRTGIGQRSDGAVLLLVIDGRQISSLGATYADMTDIFLSYGAVNACNLDGGSSSVMWYEGDYINNSRSVVGIRDVPTAVLVLKEGADPYGS